MLRSCQSVGHIYVSETINYPGLSQWEINECQTTCRDSHVKIHRTSNTILPGSWWFSPSQYQHRNCTLPLLVHRCEIMSKLGRNLIQRCSDWIGIHKLLRQCERQETSDWVCHACIHATSCRPGYGFKILPQTTLDGSKLDSLTVY